MLLIMMVCNGGEDNDLFHVFVCAGGKPPCCPHSSAVWSLSLFLSSFDLQIDLEPEGKVYVVIDLSGSSTEGKTPQQHAALCVRSRKNGRA